MVSSPCADYSSDVGQSEGGTCSLVASLWNDLATYTDSSLPRLAILKGEPLLDSSAIPSLCSDPPVSTTGAPSSRPLDTTIYSNTRSLRPFSTSMSTDKSPRLSSWEGIWAPWLEHELPHTALLIQ